MQYRRAFTKGGCYFFTVNLANRKSTMLINRVDTLKHAIADVKQRFSFHIDAMVVLPDHLHAIWTLPHEDVDFPKRWALIKSNFSRAIPKLESTNNSRAQKGERGIWQRRYWEHLIRDEQDYEQHVNYIHYNPVKHGYVTQASDWRHSSIHRYISNGTIPIDWGTISNDKSINYGERK